MDWEELPKPWTKDQCRTRYITGGDNISVRKLAKLAGRDPGLIGRWCSAGNWLEERDEFQGKVNTVALEKATYQAVQISSLQITQAILKGIQHHEYIREFLNRMFEHKERVRRKIAALPEDQQETKTKEALSDTGINQLVQASTRNTAVLNELYGIRYYVDANAALQKVEAMGYIIKPPIQESEEEGQDANPGNEL